MPTYDVTDPASGVTLQLQGDSPPTESELTDIFDKAKPKPKPSTSPINTFEEATAMADKLSQTLKPNPYQQLDAAARERSSEPAQQKTASASLRPQTMLERIKNSDVWHRLFGEEKGMGRDPGAVEVLLSNPASMVGPSGTVGKAVLGYFAYKFLEQQPDVLEQLHTQIEAGDTKGAIGTITKDVIQGGLIGVGARSAIAGEGRVATELAPETTKALQETGGTDVSIRTREQQGSNQPQYPRIDAQRQATEASSGNRPAPSPQEQAAGPQAEPSIANPAEVGKEIGYNYVPGRQIGAIKLEGLTAEERARLEAVQPVQWEFTNPDTGITFYTKEGASRQEILDAAQVKEQQAAAAVPQKATELTTPVGEQPSAAAVPEKTGWRGLLKYQEYDEPSGKWETRQRDIVISKSTLPGTKPWRATVFTSGDSPTPIGHIELDSPTLTKAAKAQLSEQLGRYIQKFSVSKKSSAAAVPEMAGMGGAAAGEKPAKAELAQLEDTLKTMAADQPKPVVSQAYNLGEKVEQAKDAVSRSISGLQAAGQYVKERLINKPVFGPFKAAIGDWHLANTESVANAKKFVQTAARAVPDKTTQAAISNYIDTGGDDALLAKAAEATKPQYKAGYEKARNLTAEEKVIAENAKNYFEARLQQAQDAGILEAGIEDYIHRQYETDSPWKDGVLAELRSGIFTGQPALAKQRVFQYDFEAEQAGKKPIKSFFKRIAAYDISLNKAIADRRLVKDTMSQKASDGRPLIDVGGTGVKIEGPTGETDATLIKPQYKPGDTQNPKNNRSDYKTYDHPALRKWKWATTDEAGKPIFVQGDVLVHPEAMGRIKALFDRSAIRQNPYGRAALGLSSTIKQTMLDLSGFHIVQIGVHALEHRTFGPIKEIDFTDPVTRGLVRGGAVVGETRGAELFSEGLTGTSLTRHIPGLGPKLEQLNDWIFNSYIPRIKVAMGKHAFERNKARFPELSEDEVYHLTANQMNAAFGEQNYAMLGRNRTTQDALRLALLAPDFLEARGRFAAQAVTGLPGMKGYGKEQFQALALGAATLYITARVINKLISDEYHFEAKNAFSVVYGGKAYSLRTVQGDLLHLVTEPGKFAYHRLNPVYGRTGLEFLTGRDVFGRKRDLLQQAQDFAQTPVPISFRGALNPREQNLMESFLNAMGVTERRSTAVDTIGKLAQDFKEKNKIVTDPGEFIYDPDKDPYRAVRQAATFSSPETVADEVAKAVAGKNKTAQQIKDHFSRYARSYFTGSQANDNKFVKSLDADQKKLYQDAKKEKQALLRNFNKGYSLYLARKRAATTTTPP